jgi:RNA polymerase sigma factor for flagellar operon FliA
VSADDLYVTHAQLIESVLAVSCRVHRLPPDHADEFRSWARLRLLDNDRAILRKFGGRSSMRTFLVTVIERLYLDWRNHEWGKWRPTNEARRLGEVAVELERQVLRDRCSFEEAAAALVTRGLAANIEECERVWVRLPREPRRLRLDEEALASVPADVDPPDPVEEQEHRARGRQLVAALEQAVAGLPPGDQIILRLRYWSGVTVARIAEIVGEDQKALYRRFGQLWSRLRAELQAQGVSGAGLDAVFRHWTPDPGEETDGGA